MSNQLNCVSIRMVEDPPLFSKNKIRGPCDAVLLIGEELEKYDREVFCVLNLMSDNKIINMNIVSIGSLNTTVVEAREVYKSAILSNAANIITIHNHPSGDCHPSREDLDVTRRLLVSGDILGIKLLDHIITGEKGEYYSFDENRTLDEIRDREEELIGLRNEQLNKKY